MTINTSTGKTDDWPMLAVSAFFVRLTPRPYLRRTCGKPRESVCKARCRCRPSAAKPHDDSFVIGNDDVLAINVWKEPDISRSIPVRSDGKISLPLVGEVQAAGLTPLSLEKDIASRLKNYISEPEVTVMVQTGQ